MKRTTRRFREELERNMIIMEAELAKREQAGDTGD